ncbi:N2-acetyl-L-ornithine:2-oxoglutarate 5-aminotransferase [Aureococcus anophagefferens]|nr:N2-acetyl-L-ornithine:2-oxoglutarate 5-aminotransferase [Aureococcus anophagefferens]
MLEIFVAGMTTPQAAATVVAAAYASYCALRYVYRRAHTGVAHKQAPAMVLTLMCMSPIPYGSRLSAPLLRSYSFTGKAYFNSDGCSDAIAARREKGANALAQRFDALMGAKAKQLNDTLVAGLSDIRFTDTNRSSEGPVLVDVDGGRAIDVSGSYGVNVCGYDAYKGFVDRAWSRVKDLGPNVLGPVHPIISDVLPALKKIANKEEVSFHMSGTEAVMCAVRLCRFNTGRKLIVQFAGAYHGWWDGVQPGPGSERANSDVLYLNDMSPAALRCIAARADEIACVCVSPLQGLNPGSPPPSDLVLLDAKVRSTAEKGNAYRAWLHQLKKVCNASDVPLLFDEVYTGFRMAPGGAQEYYGVDADVVVYGKTLGGGLANGVVCGPRLMKRRRAKPVRVAYVIGTFSAAPLTLATMSEFLAWPGRYHWMFQYYLRAEGLALSWVGTGRCLFSLDFTLAQYDAVKTALLNAAKQMRTDGWWDGDVDAKSISKIAKASSAGRSPSASRPTEPAAGAPPPSAPTSP